MTRTKIFSLSLALTLLLAAGLVGLDAAEARSWRHDGPDAAYTPEQSAELRTMWDEHYKQTKPLERQLRAKQAELEQLYYNDDNDAAKVQKVFRDMADIKAKLYTLGNDYRARCEAKGFNGGYGCGYMGGRDWNGRGGRHGWNGGGRHGGHGGERWHRGGW